MYIRAKCSKFVFNYIDFSCLCNSVVELKALPQRLHTCFLAVPLCTFFCCMSTLHLNFLSAYGVCLGPNLSFLPRQVGVCFCWLCLLQNIPSHLGHPKGEHRPWSSCICHQTMYCSSFPNVWPSTKHVSKVHWCRCLLSCWVL